MSPIKLSEILRPFEGKWVALNRQRTEVLASGDDPENVLELATHKSAERSIIKLVPSFSMDFASI